jgi:hypothetical protein
LGCGGGRAVADVDLAIVVPSRDIEHVQEGHLAIGHLMVELVESALAAGSVRDNKPDSSG